MYCPMESIRIWIDEDAEELGHERPRPDDVNEQPLVIALLRIGESKRRARGATV